MPLLGWPSCRSESRWFTGNPIQFNGMGRTTAAAFSATQLPRSTEDGVILRINDGVHLARWEPALPPTIIDDH